MDFVSVNFWLKSDLAALGVAVLIAGILLPKIILIAFKKQLFDNQGGRKVHKGFVPRLGGISFVPSILFSLALVAAVNIRYGGGDMVAGMASCLAPLLFLGCAVSLMYLVGFADDLIGVRYRAKFLAQILAGVMMVMAGIGLDNLYGFLFLESLPEYVSVSFTIILVVYFVNAINLIDGIDGLAAGLVILAVSFYSVVLFMAGQYVYSMIGCATVGTLLPFFYYNVFGDADKKKKIFMGDTGSLTVGMVVAFLALCVMRLPDVESPFVSCDRAVLAFAPMIVPCFDVIRVTIHRVRHKRNPFLPDKSHIHHKLLALALPQKVALAIILTAQIAFVVMNVWLSPALDSNILLVADILVWTLANVALTSRISVREKSLGKKLYH